MNARKAKKKRPAKQKPTAASLLGRLIGPPLTFVPHMPTYTVTTTSTYVPLDHGFTFSRPIAPKRKKP